MSLPDTDIRMMAVLCLVGAVYASGKAMDAFVAWVHELYEKFIIVDRHASQVGPHWHVKVYYRHGMGNESIVDEHKCVISTRSFRWERTPKGEIHEVEQ